MLKLKYIALLVLVLISFIQCSSVTPRGSTVQVPPEKTEIWKKAISLRHKLFYKLLDNVRNLVPCEELKQTKKGTGRKVLDYMAKAPANVKRVFIKPKPIENNFSVDIRDEFVSVAESETALTSDTNIDMNEMQNNPLYIKKMLQHGHNHLSRLYLEYLLAKKDLEDIPYDEIPMLKEMKGKVELKHLEQGAIGFFDSVTNAVKSLNSASSIMLSIDFFRIYKAYQQEGFSPQDFGYIDKSFDWDKPTNLIEAAFAKLIEKGQNLFMRICQKYDFTEKDKINDDRALKNLEKNYIKAIQRQASQAELQNNKPVLENVPYEPLYFSCTYKNFEFLRNPIAHLKRPVQQAAFIKTEMQKCEECPLFWKFITNKDNKGKPRPQTEEFKRSHTAFKGMMYSVRKLQIDDEYRMIMAQIYMAQTDLMDLNEVLFNTSGVSLSKNLNDRASFCTVVMNGFELLITSQKTPKAKEEKQKEILLFLKTLPDAPEFIAEPKKQMSSANLPSFNPHTQPNTSGTNTTPGNQTPAGTTPNNVHPPNPNQPTAPSSIYSETEQEILAIFKLLHADITTLFEYNQEFYSRISLKLCYSDEFKELWNAGEIFTHRMRDGTTFFSHIGIHQLNEIQVEDLISKGRFGLLQNPFINMNSQDLLRCDQQYQLKAFDYFETRKDLIGDLGMEYEQLKIALNQSSESEMARRLVLNFDKISASSIFKLKKSEIEAVKGSIPKTCWSELDANQVIQLNGMKDVEAVMEIMNDAERARKFCGNINGSSLQYLANDFPVTNHCFNSIALPFNLVNDLVAFFRTILFLNLEGALRDFVLGTEFTSEKLDSLNKSFFETMGDSLEKFCEIVPVTSMRKWGNDIPEACVNALNYESAESADELILVRAIQVYGKKSKDYGDFMVKHTFLCKNYKKLEDLPLTTIKKLKKECFESLNAGTNLERFEAISAERISELPIDYFDLVDSDIARKIGSGFKKLKLEQLQRMAQVKNEQHPCKVLVEPSFAENNMESLTVDQVKSACASFISSDNSNSNGSKLSSSMLTFVLPLIAIALI